jgi:hypothetical protein
MKRPLVAEMWMKLFAGLKNSDPPEANPVELRSVKSDMTP